MAWLIVLLCASVTAHGAPVEMTLASGHLAPGAFGLFNFTLGGNVGTGESLRIGTNGSSFDTEIAVFDARGRLVATNDDIGPYDLSSELLFGGGKRLNAGTYTAVLSGFNTIFQNGNVIPGSSPGGDFFINLESTQPVELPSVPSYLAKDGNILPRAIAETELGHGVINPGGVERFDFLLQDDIVGGDWLTIHTSGSDFDTEIGLYDSRGKLLASNDDIGPRNLASRLSFGLDGDNGRRLLAGAYSVLMGGFNTIFGQHLVATSSHGSPGDYALYVQSSARIARPGDVDPLVQNTVPEPSSVYLVCLGLLALWGRRLWTGRLTNEATVFDREPAHGVAVSDALQVFHR
jgi:hypothetical protein